MTRYKVVDPKGIIRGDKTVEKADSFIENPHSAQVRAWVRFGQIVEVKEKAKAEDPEADAKRAEAEKLETEAKQKAEQEANEKAEAEAKAKAEADAKGGNKK